MHNDTSTFADPQLESLLPATASGRRGFLAAASTVGFALAAGPVQAQSVIRTSADGLDAGDIWVPVGSEKMPAYMAAPAKAGKYPVVIVVPEVFGMHEYQKDICRRLAKLGYVGITSDPFFRSGDLSKMTNIGEVVGMANKLADTQMLSDMDDLVAFIEKQPKAHAGKIGITGMCRGGRTVWMAIAHNKKIKAGVSWYGGLNPIPVSMPQTPHDVAGALNGPVLGLYGGADTGIPVSEVARLQEVLKAGNKNSQASRFVLYPGVGHAFHADYRPSYRKEAAEDGWQKMLAWFKAHGVA
ncbi:MAG TPA: dienelactone hydrolase family protein [Burkholderiaceae bacterium]|nr:dienelactone hydrolase family protein [Burkholderiaceae bacterium]